MRGIETFLSHPKADVKMTSVSCKWLLQVMWSFMSCYFLMKKYFLWYPQSVEEDFVDMRKDNPESISAEDLHRLLVLAR